MTIFERIIKREIPAEIVFENEEIIAIRDIEPKAPVHLLIIPKRVIVNVNDMTSVDGELLGRMVLVAQEVAKNEGIAEGGFRLVINCNRDGGQSVDHLHIHLLGGRQLGWPPG